jgi:hypothetical protein
MASRACFAAAFASSSSRVSVSAFTGGSSCVINGSGRTISTIGGRSISYASPSRSAIVGSLFTNYNGRIATNSMISNNRVSSSINSIQLQMSSTEAETKPTTTSSSAAPRVKTDNAQVSEEQVSIKGWVRTVRKQKTLAFVEVNDGSSMSGIQCVLPFDAVDEDTMKGMCIALL